MFSSRIWLTRLVALLALLLVTSACSSGPDPESATATPQPSVLPEPTTPAVTEPRSAVDNDVLAPSSTTHLGLTWFSPAPAAVADVVLARWDEAAAASSVGRVMVDWIDVEPEQGEYRFDDVDEALAEMVESGRHPMLSIVAVDTSGTEFPEWLGGFEPERASEAYVDMVESLLPTINRHDVWLLAIANEPPLAGDDDLDRDDFATFVELTVDALDEIVPDLPVSFTFAGGDPFIDDPAIDRMVDAVDVYSVNHYCIDANLLAVPLDAMADGIDAHVARAGDAPIVFQEFGCPAGESLGSSESFQLAWFEAAFDHIADIEQVRAAFVFEFLDWSQSTWELAYGDAEDVLRAELGEGFTTRLRDWLLTSGLVRIDGTTRPAFDRFIAMASTD